MYHITVKQWANEAKSDLNLATRGGRDHSQTYRDWISSVGFSETNLAPDLDSSLSLMTKNQLSLRPIQNHKIVILDEMLKAFVQRQCAAPLTALQLATVKRLRAADTFDHYIDRVLDSTCESG